MIYNWQTNRTYSVLISMPYLVPPCTNVAKELLVNALEARRK
jgi:hypothetical protein